MELAVGPVAAAPHAADRVDGVWRVDGYGTVLSVEDGRLQEYQATAVSCLRGDTARRTGQSGSGSVTYTGDDATVYRIRPAAGGAGAILYFDGSVGDRRLLRLPALPASCAKAAPTGAPATFDVFWQTFEENYPFSAAKKIDWQAVRDRYRPRVHDGMPETELFALLREMVLPLYDAHVGIDAGNTGGFGQSRPGTVIPGPGLDQQARRSSSSTTSSARDCGPSRTGASGTPGCQTEPATCGSLASVDTTATALPTRATAPSWSRR
ncbi:hypothetical protein [Streptomyces sp. Ag82_O1-15]|uniref:hypothetical protein n=1 Tax=Streptomyces sp. Ag82_O1-15 TaxID=1938855 RepID=UPI00211BBB02|nr:hypothetical protein [Streptomyces sp. Ag82_O1-15]